MIRKMTIDEENGCRRSRLTSHAKVEDSVIFSFPRTENDPPTPRVGKRAEDVVLSALNSREKTEGSDVFFSGSGGNSSTSSVGRGAWDVVWSALDILPLVARVGKNTVV